MTGLSFLHLYVFPSTSSQLRLMRTQLGTIIGAGLDFPEFSLGYGTHTYYISEQSYIQFQKYSYGEWIQTFATLMWTKVSICLFLLRIPVAKSLVRPLQAMIFVLIVSNIVLTLLWILQCSPVYAAWDVTIQKSADCFSKWRLQQIILAQASKIALSSSGVYYRIIRSLMTRNSYISVFRLHPRGVSHSDPVQGTDRSEN